MTEIGLRVRANRVCCFLGIVSSISGLFTFAKFHLDRMIT